MSTPDSLLTQRALGPLFPRAAFDLVAIAASAGGVSALRSILGKLQAPFPVPIAIVQHLPAHVPSQLAEVLGWRSRLPTAFAREGERLRAGSVFIAPPNCHLVIAGGPPRFALEYSERVNYVRPAADRFFATAAAQFGPRLLSVVLTGAGRDGAIGAAEVKRRGGAVIVQDPGSAEADGMPRAALAATSVDLVLPLDAMPCALSSLCEVIGTRELFCGGGQPTSSIAA